MASVSLSHRLRHAQHLHPNRVLDNSGNARRFPPTRTVSLPGPFDPPQVNSDPEGAVQSYSEACWVAFSRHVSHVCPSAVRLGLLAGDIDRLPADLPVVPMQISLRDLIALGLSVDMSIQEARGDCVEMSGPSGLIKSSAHPLLGVIIHFTAFSAAPRLALKGLINGDISRSWLRRLQGIAFVANREYDTHRRHHYESLAMKWRSHAAEGHEPIRAIKAGDDSSSEPEPATFLRFVDMNGAEHMVPIEECETWEMAVRALDVRDIAKAPYIIRGPENKVIPPKSWKPLVKVIRQGNLETSFKVLKGDYIQVRPADTPEPEETKPGTNEQREGEILEESAREGNGQQRTGAAPPPAGPQSSEGSQPGSNDPPPLRGGAPEKSEGKKSRKTSRKAKLMIEYPDHSDASGTSVSTHEKRQRGRPPPIPPVRRFSFSPVRYLYWDWQNDREEAYVSSSTPYVRPPPPVLSFFWASQLDVELGCWATPWGDGLYRECILSLPMMVDIALEALDRISRQSHAPEADADGARGKNSQISPQESEARVVPGIKREVLYVDFHSSVLLDDLWVHLRKGGHTWPPYALNARADSRGVMGDLTRDVSPVDCVTFPAFGGEKLPPLLLLRSVRDAHHQAEELGRGRQTLVRDRLLELASIDLWLTQAAAIPALQKPLSGNKHMAANAAAIVEQIWLAHGDEIMSRRTDAVSRDGGDWLARDLAKEISQNEEIWGRRAASVSWAQSYFVWVAFLRAVKVQQCIYEGPDTRDALGLFEDDILVYMA